MNTAVQKKLGLLPRGFLLVLLAGAGASLYFGLTAALSDAMTMQARWQIAQWQSNPLEQPKAPDLGRIRNDLMSALRWTPADPQIYENLGYLYGVRANSLHALPELEQAMLENSIAYYKTAIALRPMSAHAWANLALALHLKTGQQEAMWSAYDRAFQYGNREAGVQYILAEVGFSCWEEAGTARQLQLLHLIDTAYPHTKYTLLKIAQKYGKEDLLGK